MPARIIDTHVHHLDDSQASWARELGYEKVCLMDYRVEVLREALRKHPDFVIALGWLPMHGEIAPAVEAVDVFRDAGCLGYKICGSCARYDDERFYPVYEKIREYRMPIFFHTGWLDQRIMQQTYPTGIRMQAEWYHPLTLDRITLDFPELKLVAFHLGGAWIEHTSLLMHQFPNIYADTCRKFGSPSHFWGQIGGDEGGYAALAKLVYGTDGISTRDRQRDRIDELDALFDALDVPNALRDRVWYRNALHILGLDEELKKKVRVGKIDASTMTLDRPAKGAARIEDFVSRVGLGEPAESATRCSIGYDAEALHLHFICEDDKADALSLTPEGPVGDIWQDDSVEIFISPGAGEEYHHFVLSATGRAAFEKGRKNMKAFPGAASARIDRDGWRATISISFKLLGAAPKAGDVWGLQLCRSKQTAPADTLMWMEVATTFHDPSSFGRMVFE